MRVKYFCIVLVIVALVAALPLAAAADELEDQIKLGLKLYQQGKYNKAAEELEFALAQLRQKKANSLTAVFPEAPSGWKAQEPMSKSAASGLLGGGISASRAYRQEGGKGRASIELMSDSPLIQSLGMMLSNPMFMQGNRGARLVKVQGYKAMLSKRGRGAELQALVEGKVLLKVSASRCPQPEQVVLQLARKIDMNKLKQIIK